MGAAFRGRNGGYGRVLFDACLSEIENHPLQQQQNQSTNQEQDSNQHDLDSPSTIGTVLKQRLIVGLDAVAAQKANYERRGFEESPHGTIRTMTRDLACKTVLPFPVSNPSTFASSLHGEAKAGRKRSLLDIKDVPLDQLVASDEYYTGLRRERLWTPEFFNRPDVFGFAVVETQEPGQGSSDPAPSTSASTSVSASVSSVGQHEDALLAWVIVRRCLSGFRIGPLYANKNPEAAKAVLAKAIQVATPELLQTVPMGTQVEDPLSRSSSDDAREKAKWNAEVWTGNAEAEKVFKELGWESAGVDFHRMWLRGEATEAQSQDGAAHTGMFAIFDAALG